MLHVEGYLLQTSSQCFLEVFHLTFVSSSPAACWSRLYRAHLYEERLSSREAYSTWCCCKLKFQAFLVLCWSLVFLCLCCFELTAWRMAPRMLRDTKLRILSSSEVSLQLSWSCSSAKHLIAWYRSSFPVFKNSCKIGSGSTFPYC